MARIASILTAGYFSNPMAAAVQIKTNVAQLPSATSEEKVITLDEVSWHDTYEDCWIIIYDRVFDISNFLNEHPGGGDILLEYAGRDATIAFRGSGHSAQAIRALDKYFIGELPTHECIFRKPGGFRLSDMPE